jgi:hypothetical protein
MAEQFVTDLSKFSKSTQDALAASAKAAGVTTEEYLKSRGGINPITRTFGDSYDPNTDLSDAEYEAAIAGKTGPDVGKAINAATEAKLAAYVKANPRSTKAKGLASKDGDGTTTGGIYTASDGTKFDGSDEYILYQKELDKEKAEIGRAHV